MATNVETTHTDPTSEGPLDAAFNTPIERTVAAIWCEILQCDRLAPTDDFFDLGGTSLDLIRAFAQVNKQFGVSLNGSVLEEEATVTRMASCVEEAIRAAA